MNSIIQRRAIRSPFLFLSASSDAGCDCHKSGGFLDFVAQTTRCVVFLNACHPTYGGLKVAHQLWDSVFISKLVDISDEIMYNYLIRFPGC
jgi:hypothetical protein